MTRISIPFLPRSRGCPSLCSRFLCSVVILSLTLSLSLNGNTSRQRQAGSLSLHIPAMKASVSSCCISADQAIRSLQRRLGPGDGHLACPVARDRAGPDAVHESLQQRTNLLTLAIYHIYIYMLYTSHMTSI